MSRKRLRPQIDYSPAALHAAYRVLDRIGRYSDLERVLGVQSEALGLTIKEQRQARAIVRDIARRRAGRAWHVKTDALKRITLAAMPEGTYMGVTKHDRIANRIAEKKGTVYHDNRGVDIRTSTQAIEVEVDASKLKEGIKQLQGHNDKARYLAVPNKLVPAAIKRTKDTGVGVMNEHGKISKRAH